MAGDRWWKKLDPAQRQLLTEAFPSIQVTRQAIREETDGDLAKAEEMGFTVHRLTPAQRDDWQRAVGNTHQKLVAEVGGQSQEIYDLILKGKAAYAEQLDKLDTP